MESVFDVVGLTKRFDRRAQPAVDDVTISVRHGEMFGILGDNGAGKTTLVKHLAGLLRPTAGDIRFNGRPHEEVRRTLARHVAYMPQTALALNNLTVNEALYFTGHLRGLPAKRARAQAVETAERLGIADLGSDNVRFLSGGQRRLVQLGVALVGDPQVLLLDEPTNDLDPVNRRMVWSVLREAQQGGATIVFVTHDALEAEKVIETVAIMRGGRVVAHGTPAALKRDLDQPFRVDVYSPTQPAVLDGHEAVRTGEESWTVYADAVDLPRILAALDLAAVGDLRITGTSLEDLYVHYATTG